MTEEYTYFLKKEEYASLIDLREAAQYLGYDGLVPEGEIKETLEQCAKELMEVLCPAVRLCLSARRETTDGKVRIAFPDGELLLPGTAIREHLAKSKRVLCVCVTLGSRVDEWIEKLGESSMLEALLADALANAAVERLREFAERKAEEHWKQISVGWVFGIGYGDLPLTLQREFLFGMRAEQEIALTCNDKYILLPLKSVTGFSAVGEKNTKTENQNRKWQVGCCGKRRCTECPMYGKCKESRVKRLTN